MNSRDQAAELQKQTWPLVIKDMFNRNEEGAVKYNRYLMTTCPDDMLQHAYEEALDLCVYLKTQIEKENQTRREALLKEKQEWMSKNIKTGVFLRQSTPVQESLDSMKLSTSLLDSLAKLVKSRGK